MPKLREATGRWDRAAVVLVLFAFSCLVVDTFASGAAAATFAGAGAVLAGAAATRLGDIFSQSRANAESAKGSRIADLDGSRRLAYMSLMTIGTGDYGLAASLLNALVHHQEGVTEEEAMMHLRVLATGRDCDDSEAWLRGQIQRISAECEALAQTP